MNVRPKFQSIEPMTIREFLAFARTRPQEERWELIEGRPVLNPAPIDVHQMIVTNLIGLLLDHKQRTKAAWLPMPGIGTRVPVSPRSLPQPDVFVKEGRPKGKSVTDDALVIFEVLSRSNSKADQAWRRKVYASVPNCQHYVTVATKAVKVMAFDRATRWQERTLVSIDDSLELDALGLAMPLSVIYRWTTLAE
jgi:Uma2 family endonuclease